MTDVLLVLGLTLLFSVAVRIVTVRAETSVQESETRARAAIDTAAELSAARPDDYLRHSIVERWRSDHPDRAKLLLRSSRIRRLRDSGLRARYLDAARILAETDVWVSERNEGYVRSRCDELAAWFAERLPHPLTEQQRRAIVTDQDSNLVVAGAGSGKTATILGKLAYLIEQRGVPPGDILVLAFNKTAANEISERLDAAGIAAPEVSTFHAKGYQVLGRARGRKPAVSALAGDATALRRFLDAGFKSRVREDEFRERLARWWIDLRVDTWEFKAGSTPDERLRKERSLGLSTLDGTPVRSQSEVKVADWLTLHGIPWKHEARYPHSPASEERRDYTPDFYLPEHDVWIEVWACDKSERRFPPEFGESGAARYKEDMQWKRDLHAANGTLLLEIDQTDIWGSGLSEILAERLSAARVGRHPLAPDEIEGLVASIQTSFSPLVNLLASFLSLYRAGGWDRSAVVARAKSQRDREFLKLFWPFLDDYEEALEEEGKIDFDAMLSEAARALGAPGERTRRYQYILVDEYQDSSKARLDLIRGLRGAPADCRLFLVGDDWQSIYRFTGSDIGYFTKAEEYLGATARTDLDRTFRLAADVAELSTRFISKNPNQLRKRIEPRDEIPGRPGVSIRFHRTGNEAGTLAAVLSEIRDAGAIGDTLLVLGRYNFQLEVWEQLGADLGADRHGQALTVHRAKGLEADHVIVLGLGSGAFGFPSEIDDDRVLQMLLGKEDPFANAEERRLFYVALTRTRGRVYLLADTAEPSPFVQELLGEEYANWIELFGEESERYRCPQCRGKTIQRREGRYGSFWGCLHYSACRGRLATCPECSTGVLERVREGSGSEGYRCSRCQHLAEVCPRCSVGALIPRTGRHGPFMGCSEWRPDSSGCDYTTQRRS